MCHPNSRDAIWEGVKEEPCLRPDQCPKAAGRLDPFGGAAFGSGSGLEGDI